MEHKSESEVSDTLVSILDGAIESEIESEQKYLRAAELACDTRVRDFLISLAEMEREHKELLTKQLEELRAQMKVVDEMNDMFV